MLLTKSFLSPCAVYLGEELADAEQLVSELQEQGWLDQYTRALFVESTLYNANVNLFVNIKLLFEAPVTGGTLIKSHLQPFR